MTTQTLETFRCRIYVGEEPTHDSIMFSAIQGGFSGESRRYGFPSGYYETHCVDDGWYRLDRNTMRIINDLLRRGWVRREERTMHAPEEKNGLFDAPAHTVTYATYYATDFGRAAWAGAR